MEESANVGANIGSQVFEMVTSNLSTIIPLGVTAMVTVLGFTVGGKLVKKIVRAAT